MSVNTLHPSFALNGIAPLPHLGVIRAAGADAASFLHNQLTNDVLLMKDGQCRLAAYCNAKGRMHASFVVYKRSAEELLLIGRQDLLAQTVKRLSMFVLRAKVKLTDATADFQLLGLAGDALSAALGSVAPAALAPWQRIALNVGEQMADVLTLYPALNQARGLWIAPNGVASPTGPALSVEQWQVGEVMSGIAWVEQATFEAFVPQMLNYESVGGVNFKKGCYPGQEVVARSQFRGTLKRRMARVFSAQALQAGQAVFTPTDPEQPCATVVQSAARPDGSGFDALVSGTLESMASGWRAGSAQGEALTLLPLPYPLLEDI